MNKTLFSLCLMVLASSAFARGYGMAGCGLGSIVMGDKKGMMQIFASTTNGTFGTQTFGISSGTSNCMDGSGKTASVFIEANKASLANDIARGKGETLSSLAAMYGCADIEGLGVELQKNYKTIFTSSQVEATEIDARIREVVVEEQVACTDLV